MWCNVRNKTSTCKTPSIHGGEPFTPSLHSHCHQPQPRQQKSVKRAAFVTIKDVFRTTAQIVDEALLKLTVPKMDDFFIILSKSTVLKANIPSISVININKFYSYNTSILRET